MLKLKNWKLRWGLKELKMFDIGDKVICVDDNFYSNEDRINVIINLFKQLPKKGQEYTVREFRPTKFGIGVLLEEISNPPIKLDGTLKEPGFALRRFKNISEIQDKVKEYEFEESRN